MNLHTPERGPRESREDYAERRKSSAWLAKTLRTGPRQDPLPPQLAALPGAWKRFWLGQHTNPQRVAVRAMTAALGRRQALKRQKAIRRQEAAHA